MYTTIQKFVISKCFNVFERSLYLFDLKTVKTEIFVEIFYNLNIKYL